MRSPFQKSAIVPPGRRISAARSQRTAGSTQCQAWALNTSRKFAAAASSNGSTWMSTGRPAQRRRATAAMTSSGSNPVMSTPRTAKARVAMPVPDPTSMAGKYGGPAG
jgi:hypothetical protein